MSKKEVEESKLYFVPAKAEKPLKGKTTYLDGIKINKVVSSEGAVSICYGENATELPDGKGVFAKKITYSSGRSEHFILFATIGANINKMINPWGLYYNSGDEVKYEKQMGRNKYEYRKVSEEVFQTYIKFLETRAQRYILTAERNADYGQN
jgi:hypothetical protein